MEKEHTINIRSTSNPKSIQQPNLPCADLVNGSREDYFKICVPLCKASIRGDWATAKDILDKSPELVRFGITENLETALHVAASAESMKMTKDFVLNLVEKLDEKDLELQNKDFNTALCLAAIAGNYRMAEIMLKKNKALLSIPGCQGMTPLYMAALYAQYNMVRYLYVGSENLTGDFWTPENRHQLLFKCVEHGFFDVALNILKDCKELTTDPRTVSSLLNALAQKPYAFHRIKPKTICSIIYSILAIKCLKLGRAERETKAMKLLRFIWDNAKKMPKADVDDIFRGPAGQRNEDGTCQYPSRIFFVATEMGNAKFVVELLRAYPDLIWMRNDDNHSIFHKAVIHRHHHIYNLLYEIGQTRNLITAHEDRHGNNILHLAAVTPEIAHVQSYGVSLLMQREILWFLEVQRIVPFSYREKKNKDGHTPYDLFYKNNKDVVPQRLKWMKDCMVVATLIVTIAFAVAFTVPGGYKQDNGIPIFIHERTFLVFVIADAVSLFFSSASLLLFLSILTSRHDKSDFLKSLPKKLMIGLVTLFISIASMMVTFSANFFVLYRNRLKWVPILISVSAAMPVILFAVLQFPLFVEMVLTTIGAEHLFPPKRRILQAHTMF